MQQIEDESLSLWSHMPKAQSYNHLSLVGQNILLPPCHTHSGPGSLRYELVFGWGSYTVVHVIGYAFVLYFYIMKCGRHRMKSLSYKKARIGQFNLENVDPFRYLACKAIIGLRKDIYQWRRCAPVTWRENQLCQINSREKGFHQTSLLNSASENPLKSLFFFYFLHIFYIYSKVRHYIFS